MTSPHRLALVRRLLSCGENIVVRAVVKAAGSSSLFDIETLGIVRPLSQGQPVVGQKVDSFSVILAPADLEAGQFPRTDNLPILGDKVLIGGRPRNIEQVAAIRVGSEIVRIELKVAG